MKGDAQLRLNQIVTAVLLLLVTTLGTAQDCYESSVLSPSPFMGNNGEVFKLADGSIWEVKYEYEYLYEYYPSVIICPGRGKLGIKGKMLNVQIISAGKVATKPNAKESATPEIIESRIDGEFSGWEGDTIFKLMNGQVWQQVDGRYKYKYNYAPKVLIFKTGGGYEMQVDGVDGRVRVSRLK